MAVDGLFSSDLVSPDVSAALPEGYRLRALRKTDFASGFLDCLRVLTTVGEISQEQFEQQFDDMERQGSYYIIVIEDTNRSANSVVGTGALIVEKKLYVAFPHEAPNGDMCYAIGMSWLTHEPLRTAFTASETLDTSKILQSPRINKARSLVSA